MLGQCLGPAYNEGNEMAQWILKDNAKVIICRIIQKLTAHDLAPSNQVQIKKDFSLILLSVQSW